MPTIAHFLGRLWTQKRPYFIAAVCSLAVIVVLIAGLAIIPGVRKPPSVPPPDRRAAASRTASRIFS